MNIKTLEYAIAAAGVFVRHLHRDGVDRGMVATFGSTFRVEQEFTSSESHLLAALNQLRYAPPDPETRLYDSLEDVVTTFHHTARTDRPWILTIITDRPDTASCTYRNNPVAIGHYIKQHYTHKPSNFPFLIGVGRNHQLDRRVLATIGCQGCFPTLVIDTFAMLEAMFLQIALSVSTCMDGIRVRAGNLSWNEVRRVRQTSPTAFDYAFLFDRSGASRHPA